MKIYYSPKLGKSSPLNGFAETLVKVTLEDGLEKLVLVVELPKEGKFSEFNELTNVLS